MISVISDDCELDAKPNKLEMNRAEARFSDYSVRSNEVRGGVSEIEFDSKAPESEANARILENEGSDEVVKARHRVCEESVEIKNEENTSPVQFDPQDDRFDYQDYDFEAKTDLMEHDGYSGDSKGEVYKSLLSEFEDFVANEKNGSIVGTSRALRYGFDVGDMVWGKVKSHPWWPGHIFNEGLASSSVRRTRREGYVLVAFFGDSSYGWFDPAELIPFDLHFNEKSQQTNARNFVKAVEEAVDEASRRQGLGLVCRCRNQYNFRPLNVQGYFVVDVPDYEPGGVYSVNQVKKARDGFLPVEALAFVKQLALAPGGYDQNSIDFIKNKATAFALRKAVFEEFDETYAQAFGVQFTRPSNDTANISDQPVKQPTRAPLSGPLVIAEALGGGKSFKKPVKVKDQTKKDRYLFKRRDEPSDSWNLPVGQRKESPSTATMESSSAIAAGDFVLQKRAPLPQISEKQEQNEFGSKECLGPSDVSGKETVILDQASGSLDALANRGASLDAKESLDRERPALQETKEKMGLDVSMGPARMGQSDLLGNGVMDDASASSQQVSETMAYPRYEESTKTSRSIEDPQQIELNLPTRVEGVGGLSKFQHDHSSLRHSQLDSTHSVPVSADGGVKKAKVLKRPLGDSEKTIMGEKKKKKKKELASETTHDHPKKHLATGKGGAVVKNSIGKSTQFGLAPRVGQQKKDVGTSNVGVSSMVGTGNIELKLPQLLSDLHGLALDPFHGAERNIHLITIQFFLQFRSLVYQKSLVLSPPSETDPTEFRASKSPSTIGASDNLKGENVRDSAPSKSVKSLVRPDDPIKAGQKRPPSDRQEEIVAKRLKKINKLKSLAAEKKAGPRTLEAKRAEGKEPVVASPTRPVKPVSTESVAAAPTRPVKPVSVKKMEPSARSIEPTMLVMKFPPKTSLPSVAELKARFARFGSIDQSAIRVFWQSSTCRVVFRHKVDAQAAYKYAVRNHSLFGNVNVRYSLRAVGAPAPEAPTESDKGRGDDTCMVAPRVKDPVIAQQPPPPQSTVQLKSILRKPTGDDAAQVNSGNNGGRGTHVKFMLGGEETSTSTSTTTTTTSSRGEQSMIGYRNNFNNNTSFADGGRPTSVDMDFISKNFHKDIPPSPLSPILPFPAQLVKVPLNNMHHTEVAPRNLHNLNPPIAAPDVDISQQMLSLLTRCNDVISTVTGMLGYVPYHPL